MSRHLRAVAEEAAPKATPMETLRSIIERTATSEGTLTSYCLVTFKSGGDPMISIASGTSGMPIGAIAAACIAAIDEAAWPEGAE